jgi:hypothetical protein
MLLIGSAAFALGWYHGRSHQIVQSGVSEAMANFAVLGCLARASVAMSKRWTASREQRSVCEFQCGRAED